MESGSENGGSLSPLHFHKGVLAFLDFMYLLDLSFKTNMYQCQRYLSYNAYFCTNSTIELMCFDILNSNNNSNNPNTNNKLKLKITFIIFYLRTTMLNTLREQSH